MFKIVDGREYFYQWDLDRQVAVEDTTITEVHFCNRADDCSLVVEVKDGIANVPNVILQKSFNVRVFGYDGKATRYDKVFEVKARSKPSDYVYAEVEIKRYDDLNKRIDEIEKNGISEEVITEAVENYLEKNPVDLEGYATEDYVDEAIKSHVPDIDFTGLATEEYVDKAIEGIEIPEPEKVDLTGYAKEQWVKDQGYLTEHQDLSNYAKRTDIPTKVSQLSNDKGYLTKHQDISHLATIGQIQTVEGKIPTKTSQLTNDSGYLTQHQDISGKADIGHTHPSYALKTEIPDISGKADKDHTHSQYLTEHQSLDGYATEKYVDDAIAGIDIPEGGGDTDLSNYYTKEETDAAIYNSKDTYYLDFQGTPIGEETAIAATADMAEFAERYQTSKNVCVYLRDNHGFGLNGWTNVLIGGLNNNITLRQANIDVVYIKENKRCVYYDYHLKLVDGAWVKYKVRIGEFTITTKEYVDEAIANIEIPEGGNTDLTNYYTKDEVNALFEGIATAEGGSY